jgi:hypothetical protein
MDDMTELSDAQLVADAAAIETQQATEAAQRGWVLDDASNDALAAAVDAGAAAREAMWQAGLAGLHVGPTARITLEVDHNPTVVLRRMQTPAQAALQTLEALGYTLTRKDT